MPDSAPDSGFGEGGSTASTRQVRLQPKYSRSILYRKMLYESLESFLWNLLPLTLATRSLPEPKRHSETSERQRARAKPLDSSARWVV